MNKKNSSTFFNYVLLSCLFVFYLGINIPTSALAAEPATVAPVSTAPVSSEQDTAEPVSSDPDTIIPPLGYTQVWTKNHFDLDLFEVDVLLPLPDGGLIGTGSIQSKDDYGMPPALEIWRFNANGKLLWRKRPVHSAESTFGSAVLLANGDIVLVGGINAYGMTPCSYASPDNSAVLVLRITQSGRILWENTYPSPLGCSYGATVLELPDKSIFIAGSAPASNPDSRLDGNNETQGLALWLMPDGTKLQSQTIAESQMSASSINSAILDAPRKRILLANHASRAISGNVTPERSEWTSIKELSFTGQIKELANFDGYDLNLSADPFNPNQFFLSGTRVFNQETRSAVLFKLDENFKLLQTYSDKIDGQWITELWRVSADSMFAFVTSTKHDPLLVQIVDNGAVIKHRPFSDSFSLLRNMVKAKNGIVFLAARFSDSVENSHDDDVVQYRNNLWLAKWKKQ